MSNQSPLPEQLAVLGVGSPHGDDHLGWTAIRSLRNSVGPGIVLREIAAPAQILHHLEGIVKLVVVDGCLAGLPAGTVVRFQWPNAALQHCRSGTSHGLSMVEALSLAQALGRLPREVSIVLMEIGDAAPGKELTESVSKALPELVTAVEQEIGSVKGRRGQPCTNYR